MRGPGGPGGLGVAASRCGTAPLHSAHYDFNDAIIAPAARYWVRLAETFLI